MAQPDYSRRSVIHDLYGKDFAQMKDTRDMDNICQNPNQGFSLQAQQTFLKRYVSDNRDWKSLLLYHEIGSGKTCSAITIAEEYMKVNLEQKKRCRVSVILPARLKTNFVDELLSPCAMNKYMTKADLAEFMRASTTKARKAAIRKSAEDRMASKYDIMSFEKFVKGARENDGKLDAWAKAFTKNRLIIFDEVHNLLSTGYDIKHYDQVLRTGRLVKNMKSINAIIFKYLVSKADPTCKMVFMTATPVFDHITQFKELVSMVSPEFAPQIANARRMSQTIRFLRGKVSYFPGTSPAAYPMVETVTHDVRMTQTQHDVIRELQDDEGVFGEEDAAEAFMSKQRQATIACLPDNASIARNKARVQTNLPEYAPKIVAIMKELRKNPKGKHLVYSSFIDAGIRVVEDALRKDGWASLEDVTKDPSLAAKKPYKVFASWDGSVKDHDKTLIKTVVNSVDNMDGVRVRVILGSPSIKEGVSFKHIQHLHLLDPVWNSSAKAQVEGRAIRFCSHVDIPANHPFLKRKVIIHEYKLVLNPVLNGTVAETSDMKIYDDIIPRKRGVISKAEAFLKKISLDYHLFRRLHENAPWDGRINRTNINLQDPFGRSAIRLSQEDDIAIVKSGKSRSQEQLNKCPSSRRPNGVTGLCPTAFPFRRENAHGNDCCYKTDGKAKSKTKTNTKSTASPTGPAGPGVRGCPVDRRPVNGQCQAGQEARPNKYNVPCCYKRTAKQAKAKQPRKRASTAVPA